jgi:hypothetical protein
MNVNDLMKALDFKRGRISDKRRILEKGFDE